MIGAIFCEKQTLGMYEELLNFLLARKKRLLSSEETDRLMELIAQSMEMDEGCREQGDNAELIRKILDNVEVEEIGSEESESVGNAIGELFFEEDSDGSVSHSSDGMCESDDRSEPLSERKFRRGVFGGRGDGKQAVPKKRMVGIKDAGGSGLPKDAEDMLEARDSKADEQRLGDDGNGDISGKAREGFEKRFKLPGLGGERKAGAVEGGCSEECEEEFRFEIGDLKRVSGTGPDVKFFDEDGQEL